MTALLVRYRGLCVAALLASATAAALFAMQSGAADALRAHPYFTIDQLVINGCGPGLTPGDVRTWLGLNDATTLWQASPARLRARLETHPYVARAAVRRAFPGRLEIEVRERRPQAIAVLDALYYVDRGGVTFGPLRPQDSRDYPLITGLDPAGEAGPRTWALRRALRLLRRCDRDACVGGLSEIHVGDERGMVVYLAEPRVPIVLGWGSWPAKLERAERALQAWQGSAERLASLDVRFRNQVVLRLRSQAPPPPPPPVARPKAPGLPA